MVWFLSTFHCKLMPLLCYAHLYFDTYNTKKKILKNNSFYSSTIKAKNKSYVITKKIFSWKPRKNLKFNENVNLCLFKCINKNITNMLFLKIKVLKKLLMATESACTYLLCICMYMYLLKVFVVCHTVSVIIAFNI